MKALSMKQPVPELILQGKKTIELRKWNTKFRGEFYLHASNSLFENWVEKFNFNKEQLTKGALVGKAEILEVKPYMTIEQFKADRDKHLVNNPEKLPMYGFILKNKQRLENPIPYKGQLNFFEVKLKEEEE